MEIVGDYKILSSINRDKFGNKLFKVECIKCGNIKEVQNSKLKSLI